MQGKCQQFKERVTIKPPTNDAQELSETAEGKSLYIFMPKLGIDLKRNLNVSSARVCYWSTVDSQSIIK